MAAAKETKPTRPTKLGHYDVGPKIAGGGMATLYLGKRRGADGIDRVAALKVMRDDLAGEPQYIQMFLDEARILSRLSHPNIIQTYEYGVGESEPSSLRYIAMELLLGRSLMDAWEAMVLKKTHAPFDVAAYVCSRVADGLHYAHELRDADGSPLEVIHRDVNPTNVFLTYDTRIKLIDFGLARSKKRQAKSAEGIVKGKIPYLAPEQAAGAPFDRRVDVYSLGATLWEVTVGKRLFKRDNDVETLRAIQRAEVPDARDLVEDYPEGLHEIVARALAKRPNDRYDTAAELAEALDAWVDEHGRPAMDSALKAWLEQLFPGEAAKQAKWLRDVTKRADTATTIMPPAPLPEED